MSTLTSMFINSNNLGIYDIVVNSENRNTPTTTTSTNFIISLANPINERYIAYALKSATIPKSYYNVQSGRNTIQILDSVNTKTIVVPPGNYTLALLMSTIQTAINAVSPDTFTITYDAVTARVTITSTFNDFAINPNAFGLESLVVQQLGWNLGINYTSLTGSLTAPNMADVSGIKSAYIEIAEFTKYVRNTTNAFHNFRIGMNGQFGDVIYWTDESGYHQYFNVQQANKSNIKNLNIRLVDEYGEDLDLNGLEWAFTLQLITKPL